MKKFIKFDPSSDNAAIIPSKEGNYIFCMNKGSKLPDIGIKLVFTTYEGYEVIYTGISRNLHKREYKQHFNGNAGISTLRKSLGSMFGYNKIPRSKTKEDDRKTKFNENDENTLSQWMRQNLLLFFVENTESAIDENELIVQFNPPLNISKASNASNSEFRKRLSVLRKEK